MQEESCSCRKRVTGSGLVATGAGLVVAGAGLVAVGARLLVAGAGRWSLVQD